MTQGSMSQGDMTNVTGLESIRQRLWHGEVLRILFAEGVGFDTWVEKYGNPPQMFFEGRARPVEDLDDVMVRIGEYLEEQGVRTLWNGAVPRK